MVDYVQATEKPENDGFSDWVTPKDGKFRLQCCDCALVHDVELKAEPHSEEPKIVMRFRRHPRATHAARLSKRRTRL